MKIVRYLLLLVLFVTIGGCQKELGPNDPIHFTVYGAVYNSAGEPVNGAKITLEGATAGSTVSGIDGQFSIPCIVTGNIIPITIINISLKPLRMDTMTIWNELPL